MAKKKVSTKPLLINFILDESGSMSSITDSVISGFNEYIKSLDGKEKYKFTLTKFDSTGIRTPYVSVDLKDVKPLNKTTYQPGAMTPLYDAVCETVIEVEKEAEEDQAVVVIVMTDGEENCSKEYTESQFKEMIKRLESKGNWTFTYMGANQDSWEVAQKYGMQRGNVANWQATPQGTKSAFTAMSASTVMLSAQASLGINQTSSFYDDTSDVKSAAQTLGSLGGQATSAKGSDFYRKIGELGRQSRYRK